MFSRYWKDVLKYDHVSTFGFSRLIYLRERLGACLMYDLISFLVIYVYIIYSLTDERLNTHMRSAR